MIENNMGEIDIIKGLLNKENDELFTGVVLIDTYYANDVRVDITVIPEQGLFRYLVTSDNNCYDFVATFENDEAIIDLLDGIGQISRRETHDNEANLVGLDSQNRKLVTRAIMDAWAQLTDYNSCVSIGWDDNGDIAYHVKRSSDSERIARARVRDRLNDITIMKPDPDVQYNSRKSMNLSE